MELNNVVIEIQGVDFLITPKAAEQIASDSTTVSLHRLVDNTDVVFPLDEIKKAIENGIVDKLED